jgi:hypothetical protein
MITIEEARALRVSDEREEEEYDEERISEWARAMNALIGMDIDKATDLAKERVRYRKERLWMQGFYQSREYTLERLEIIRKIEAEDPLALPKDEDHARAITYASFRHRATDYGEKLREAKDLAFKGVIGKEEVRDYARAKYKSKVIRRFVFPDNTQTQRRDCSTNRFKEKNRKEKYR